MERDERLNPEDLQREEWNSLQNNYDKHDVGEAYFTGRMHQIGLLTENWGIDMRDDDEGGLIFDDKMDLRLWEPDGDYGEPTFWPDHDLPESTHVEGLREYHLRGVCDIKTKASQSWLGKFNLRHLAHYAYWADNYDVPVFLYFTLVDMENESVGEKNIIVNVPAFENHYDYVRHFDHDDGFSMPVMQHIIDDCPIVANTFRAPDGNPVVELDRDAYHDFDWVVENVL